LVFESSFALIVIVPMISSGGHGSSFGFFICFGFYFGAA